MPCYSCTIGTTTFPKFNINGVAKCLPRPYQQSNPGDAAHKLMSGNWFKEMINDIEEQVFYYLVSIYPNKDKAFSIISTLFDIKEAI